MTAHPHLHDVLRQANELLSCHALAGVRLVGWDRDDQALRLEVFDVEWPKVSFGELVFHDVSYLMLPVCTTWGVQLRMASREALPGRFELEPAEVAFELFANDAEPDTLIVAERLEVRRAP